jgi:hypothetical protein
MSRITGWLSDPKSPPIAPQPAPMSRGVAAIGAGNR